MCDETQIRKNGKLNIIHQGIDIKQNYQVTYHGFILDEAISGEPMACKTIKKINSRLNYLFSKKHFFDTRSQMALMQCIDSAVA